MLSNVGAGCLRRRQGLIHAGEHGPSGLAARLVVPELEEEGSLRPEAQWTRSVA